ncbi:hypothetical protein PAI11_03450 [Patulibacter medicamentivorans]|uniref:Uncharacterized protein n=1 Tax=Patulibacter medicamentivorans TaxID=1097667 RepID=H0E0N7_9ACTN|nr:hypothetical protein [Patulibacter medicamentivorans]EHN12771.1 hypothetical protein PAI11_03450 [Patulibacter medicamentivorans]
MTPPVGHVAGVPFEELLLAFAPALAAVGGAALATARGAAGRWRIPRRRRTRR